MGRATTILVIGFGNTLRRDDGLGPLIAEEISRWNCPDVRSIAVFQLTPELAVPVSAADLVIFVDARVGDEGCEARLERLQPPEQSRPSMIHALCPRSLLGLTFATFRRCPAAWLVAVPSDDFAFGEGLSAMARQGMKNALDIIKTLIPLAGRREPVGLSECLWLGLEEEEGQEKEQD
jgi:hydrogenase maturation protease